MVDAGNEDKIGYTRSNVKIQPVNFQAQTCY